MKKKRQSNCYPLRSLNIISPNVDVPLDHKDAIHYWFRSCYLHNAQMNGSINYRSFCNGWPPQKWSTLSRAKIQGDNKALRAESQKSKKFFESSKILIEVMMDGFPRWPGCIGIDYPGGHKTASVVSVWAFNVPAFGRYPYTQIGLSMGIGDGSSVAQTERDLKLLIPVDRWIKSSSTKIILFGRKYCPARGHNQEDCPICHQYGIKSRMWSKTSCLTLIW